MYRAFVPSMLSAAFIALLFGDAVIVSGALVAAGLFGIAEAIASTKK